MLFNKKAEIEESDDLLIVFDDQKKTSDVQRITDIDSEAVTVTGLYKIPLEECEITNSPSGRNFFYRAPSQSVTETKRLAQLEKNLVLNQITRYREPATDQGGVDFVKIGLIVTIIIAFIMFGLSSCNGG